MARNLILLFSLVILAISGFAWYHAKSVSPLKVLPIQLAHWEDTTSRATVRQVLQLGIKFVPTPPGKLNFGYTESIHWFRYRLEPDRMPNELTLEIRNHVISYVDLIAVRQGKIVSLTQTGSWLPFARRPTPTKTFAFPIDASQPADYYLRLDNRYENLATDILLWRTSDFENKEQREYFLWGIFTGVVLLVVLLNLIFWKATADRVYLWYAIYLTGLSLRQYADSGLGFQYVWPNFPEMNAPNPVIQANWLYVPAILQFQQYFLNLRQEEHALFRTTQGLKYFLWAGSIMLLVLQLTGVSRYFPQTEAIITSIHAVLAIIVLTVFVWVSLVAVKSDDNLKQLYGVGFTIQTAGQILNVIQNILRFSTGSSYLVDPYLLLTIIFFIDLVVFAYLLAYRYRQSFRQNQELQISLAQAQQGTNQQIIDVLDSERRHIHQLLLSEVGKRLHKTRHTLSVVNPSPMLADAVQLIEQIDQDLEQIAQNKLPVAVVEKGLTQSLTELVQQLNQTQSVQFTFTQMGGQPVLTTEQEVQIHRIITELITNVIKHAQATRAQVTLVTDAGGISLTVSDDGKGFDRVSTDRKAGIGTQNLKARARDLQAQVRQESGDSGTTITLLIPQIQTS
ncbi:sensor histidine kinase [Larkinella sp. GY13]|uniref:sensor histidine kinase n=1 Tax=Larkinella sp. GY13 TaxID=3453720 RepID=UPI003EEB50A3